MKAHIDLLQEEFQRLLEQDKEDDLNRMYNLLHRIPDGLDPLRARFEEYVKRVGLSSVERIVTEDKEPVSITSRLLQSNFVPHASDPCRNPNLTLKRCLKCTPKTPRQCRNRSEAIQLLLPLWTRYGYCYNHVTMHL